MYRLVAEILELVELIVNDEEIGSRAEDNLTIGREHTLNVVQLGFHFQKVIDHFLCGLEIAVHHRHLYFP